MNNAAVNTLLLLSSHHKHCKQPFIKQTAQGTEMSGEACFD